MLEMRDAFYITEEAGLLFIMITIMILGVQVLCKCLGGTKVSVFSTVPFCFYCIFLSSFDMIRHFGREFRHELSVSVVKRRSGGFVVGIREIKHTYAPKAIPQK